MKKKMIDMIISIIDNLAQPFSVSIGSGMVQIVEGASNLRPAFPALTTIGSALIICLFLIHFAESAIKDKQDPDSLFKDIALLILYGVIINNLPSIISALTSFCQDILNAVSNVQINNLGAGNDAANVGSLKDTMRENMKDHSLIIILFDMIIYFVLGTVAKMIIEGIALVSIYTIKIEMFIRTLFSPIAVALLAEDGWKGAGGRYIKKWSACFVQLGVIQVAITAYGAVLGLAVGGQGVAFVALIAAGFATAGVCMKSGQLANDIMGA